MKRLTFAIIVLLAMCGTAAAQPAPHAAGPDFFKSSSDSLVKSLNLQPLDQASAFGKQVMAILKAFPETMPKMPVVWTCHGCGTSSHPTLGIIIDPDQINLIQRSSGISSAAMLTFILDHEMGHQLQYQCYGLNMYMRPSVELQYLEAQADVLAGEAFFLSYPDASVSAQSGLLYKMLLTVYNLGGEQYALADHPTKNGRFLAARIGMQRALVSQEQNGALPNAASEAARIAQQIDLHPGETDLDFSLRMARRITQYNPIAARDLVYLAIPGDYHFDTDRTKRDVTYSFNYLNQGSHALTATMQVQCIAVLRTDPENLFRSLAASANVHTFTVQPGQSYIVKGGLQWVGNDDMMPRLIHTPDPFVLTEVHYADNSDVTSDSTASHDLAGARFLPSAGEVNNLVDGLNSLIEAATPAGYQALAAGVGIQSKYSSSYPSNSPLPGALDADVNLPRDVGSFQARPMVTSTFLRTYNNAEAHIAFDNLVTTTRAALLAVAVPKWSEIPGSKEDGFTFSHDSFNIVISDNTEDEDTGQKSKVTIHAIQLQFSGMKPTVLETDATHLDSVIGQIVSLADARNLVSLKSNIDYSGIIPDDPTDPNIMWHAQIVFAGMSECHLTKYPTAWQLGCRSPKITSDVGIALLAQLKAAAVNNGTLLQSEKSQPSYHNLQLYSPKGTSVRVSLSVDNNGRNSVELLVDEPEP
jgi:hypothetical protein